MDSPNQGVEELEATVAQLRAELERYQLGWPPGHFYSPIPSLTEVREREEPIFGPRPASLPGIELRPERQLALLKKLHAFYTDLPFRDDKQSGVRYFFNNPNFTHGDGTVLYGMIRHARPRRIVEIGSGYSSCAILDTNERFFGHAISCTFIEPFPDLLHSLLHDGDAARVTILDRRVQDVDIAVFEQLESGDILFVDSSHVAKVGSDVNHIYLEILPRLASGVYVHVHDVGYPFEYPKEWVYQGRAWNEVYLLRAFLLFNAAFVIELFNSYLGQFHRDALVHYLPIADRNPGTSIWLRRIA